MFPFFVFHVATNRLRICVVSIRLTHFFCAVVDVASVAVLARHYLSMESEYDNVINQEPLLLFVCVFRVAIGLQYLIIKH